MKAREAFFHPRRTARRLNDAEEELRTLRAAEADSHEALAAAEGRVAECEAECTRFEATVASLLDQLAAVRSELDAERAFTDDIDELNSRFAEMKAIKQKYEARISELKEALRAERELKRAPAVDLSEEAAASVEEQAELPASDDDWLLPLA